MAFGRLDKFDKSPSEAFFMDSAPYVRVVKALLERPDEYYIVSNIARRTGVKAKTVAYYFKRLREFDVIRKDETTAKRFYLNKNSDVVRALSTTFAVIDSKILIPTQSLISS